MSKEMMRLVNHEAGLLNLENKQELIEMVKAVVGKYQNLVVSDDEEQIKEVKKQRAELNKVANAIDSKRKEIKKEYEKPLKEFEADMKEVKGVVDEVLSDIDMKLSEAESKRIEIKTELIKSLIETHSEGFVIEIKPNWLNKTTKENHIVDDIKFRVSELKEEHERFEKSKITIAESCDSHDLTKDGYIKMLEMGVDVMDVLSSIAEAGKRKAEEQAKVEIEEKQPEAHIEEIPLPETVQEPVIENEVLEEVFTRTISVTGTKAQLRAMNDYCLSVGIVIEPVG